MSSKCIHSASKQNIIIKKARNKNNVILVTHPFFALIFYSVKRKRKNTWARNVMRKNEQHIILYSITSLFFSASNEKKYRTRERKRGSSLFFVGNK